MPRDARLAFSNFHATVRYLRRAVVPLSRGHRCSLFDVAVRTRK